METISSGNIDQLFDCPPEYSSIVTGTSQQGANTSSQPNHLVPAGQTGIRINGLCKLPTYDEAMKIRDISEKNEQECLEITSSSGETSSSNVTDIDETNTN